MATVRTGDSVYVLLRPAEEEDAGIEVHGIWSSEEAIQEYLDRLDEQGIDTDDFEWVERPLDVEPGTEEE